MYLPFVSLFCFYISHRCTPYFPWTQLLFYLHFTSIHLLWTSSKAHRVEQDFEVEEESFTSYSKNAIFKVLSSSSILYSLVSFFPLVFCSSFIPSVKAHSWHSSLMPYHTNPRYSRLYQQSFKPHATDLVASFVITSKQCAWKSIEVDQNNIKSRWSFRGFPIHPSRASVSTTSYVQRNL